METRTSPFLPALQLSVALFATAPDAAAALHAALLGAAKAAPEAQARMRYACLDASTLVSRAHIDVALDAAALALAHGTQRCHTREAEVVFRIAAGNNIGDALRTFGLSPTSTHVLLVHLGPAPADGGRSADAQLAHMQALLPGAELLPLEQLGAPHIVDWARVRKAYKLRDLGAGSDTNDAALQRRIRAREIDCVVGAVACKAVM